MLAWHSGAGSQWVHTLPSTTSIDQECRAIELRSGEEVLRPHFVQLSCTKQNSFSWRPSLTSSRGTPRHPNQRAAGRRPLNCYIPNAGTPSPAAPSLATSFPHWRPPGGRRAAACGGPLPRHPSAAVTNTQPGWSPTCWACCTTVSAWGSQCANELADSSRGACTQGARRVRGRQGAPASGSGATSRRPAPAARRRPDGHRE